ncbi:MAG: DJ-1/PfpI family protein, partial [Myxococcota bacterium]
WVKADQLDAVVVIGGTGAQDHLWNHSYLRHVVQTVHGRGGLVAAGSSASAALARAGILRGREVARFDHRETLAELRRGSAKLTERSVVVSGNVVTLSDTTHANAWAETIVGMLESYAVACQAAIRASQPELHH